MFAREVVVTNFVLNHVGDPRAGVMQMVRVARPGGWVSATVWPRPLTPLHQLWEDVIELSGARRPSTAVALAPDVDFRRTAAGLAGLLRGARLVDVEAQTFSFTHVVDPDSWWSGPARGVASMGAVVTSQSPQMIQVMRSRYDELSGRYLGADRMLHLPAAAVLASGRVPSGRSLRQPCPPS